VVQLREAAQEPEGAFAGDGGWLERHAMVNERSGGNGGRGSAEAGSARAIQETASGVTESKLAQAARHVAEGRRIVDRQRALVARLKEAGLDAFNAKDLLGQFERTLAVFEDDLRRFTRENSN